MLRGIFVPDLSIEIYSLLEEAILGSAGACRTGSPARESGEMLIAAKARASKKKRASCVYPDAAEELVMTNRSMWRR